MPLNMFHMCNIQSLTLHTIMHFDIHCLEIMLRVKISALWCEGGSVLLIFLVYINRSKSKSSYWFNWDEEKVVIKPKNSNELQEVFFFAKYYYYEVR